MLSIHLKRIRKSESFNFQQFAEHRKMYLKNDTYSALITYSKGSYFIQTVTYDTGEKLNNFYFKDCEQYSKYIEQKMRNVKSFYWRFIFLNGKVRFYYVFTLTLNEKKRKGKILQKFFLWKENCFPYTYQKVFKS